MPESFRPLIGVIISKHDESNRLNGVIDVSVPLSGLLFLNMHYMYFNVDFLVSVPLSGLLFLNTQYTHDRN